MKYPKRCDDGQHDIHGRRTCSNTEFHFGAQKISRRYRR